jgi:hypothetical protein
LEIFAMLWLMVAECVVGCGDGMKGLKVFLGE